MCLVGGQILFGPTKVNLNLTVIWMVSGRCLAGVWNVSGRRQEGVGKVSYGTGRY